MENYFINSKFSNKLLAKQLKHLGLDVNSIPKDESCWQKFLEKINDTYNDTDQERYLLERSMKISSREMLELNVRLENAQRIARLGYWYYDPIVNRITLSKELYPVFGYNKENQTPTFEEFLHRVHEEDRDKADQLVKRSCHEGINYECEIRIKTLHHKYNWYYLVGRPFRKINENNYVLFGITMDITHRKESEEAIAILNQKLLESARKAGMADVATFILHNLGNVLNSVNVSVNLLHEDLSQSVVKKLNPVAELLNKNLDHLNDFLTIDSQGKLIPKYLLYLIKIITEEHQEINNEIEQLSKSIQQIKNIVEVQNSISGTSGFIEEVNLSEVIDSAVQISGLSLMKQNIKVHRDYVDIPKILIDKSKLLQILINLIQNAKDSLIAHKELEEKIITIIISKELDEKIIIKIKDNGIGIKPDNLVKIFSFGFTTKKLGHGFGLHSSALAAKEMGGDLQVESKGIMQGAVFTLTLKAKYDLGGEK